MLAGACCADHISGVGRRAASPVGKRCCVLSHTLSMPVQILDCSPAVFDNGQGCKGTSLLASGLLFPYARMGLMSYDTYPYTEHQGTCRLPVNTVANLTHVGAIPSTPQGLMNALQHGVSRRLQAWLGRVW